MRTFHSGGVAGSDITQGLPRVEELFEARAPKKAAIMVEQAGIAYIQPSHDVPGMNDVSVRDEHDVELMKYPIPYGMRLAITDGQPVEVGQALTEGSKAPADIMRIQGLDAVYEYIIKEIQKVYRSQSVDVNDKHIEIIARQMTRKVRIEDAGDTTLLGGSTVDLSDLEEANSVVDERIANGETELKHAVGEAVLLGITKASLATESFMSAASFQETTKVLADAAIRGKVDHLRGLKENVIIGKLIPAGTGMSCYREITVEETSAEEKTEENDTSAS
jgi:DNA-directed RNA polymerase subunit beta'